MDWRIRRAEALVDWQARLVRQLTRDKHKDAALAEQLLAEYQVALSRFTTQRDRLKKELGIDTVRRAAKIDGNALTITCRVCLQRYSAVLLPSEQIERGNKQCSCGAELGAWEGHYSFSIEPEAATSST